jgi:hypothetical protein
MTGKRLILLIISLLLMVFIVLHSTPKMALRTCVFVMGYPKAALTSSIIYDDYHNEVDKKEFDRIKVKAYTLTKAPVEKGTEGVLRNYLVKKVGFFYFAKYLGEL